MINLEMRNKDAREFCDFLQKITHIFQNPDTTEHDIELNEDLLQLILHNYLQLYHRLEALKTKPIARRSVKLVRT